MKSISDLTLLGLNPEAVDMKVDTPDRGNNSTAAKVLVNNLYACIYSYSRAAVLKRFNKHGVRLLSLLDIANASAELSHDLSVGINGESFSVRECLEMIIEAIELIRVIFLESEGGSNSMSKSTQRKLIRFYDLSAQSRQGLTSKFLTDLAVCKLDHETTDITCQSCIQIFSHFLNVQIDS